MKIITRYQGPTDTRGARIVARGGGRRASCPINHALGQDVRHLFAARRLAERCGIDASRVVLVGRHRNNLGNIYTTAQLCAAWLRRGARCTRAAVGPNDYGHEMCAQHGGKAR